MGKTRFTVKNLEKLAPRTNRYNLYDLDTRGLGIAVYPSGQRTFFHCRKVQGWPERTTLGAFPDWSIELARGKAEELNAQLSTWKRNNYEGPNPLERPRKVPTLGSVLEEYCAKHLQKNAKNPEKAIKHVRWLFSHVAAWRDHPLSSISRTNLKDKHREIGEQHGEVTANRFLSAVRSLFNYALDPDVGLWDGGVNPARKPKKLLFHEESRDRVIERHEAPQFFGQLAREPHRDLRDFLLLALATAARKSTVLCMRWEQLDFDRRLWIIPNPKGKKGTKAQVVPLNALAVRVLKSRPKTSEWVFAGRKMHLTTLKKPWKRFLERTGIKNLTLHDLRRTTATRAGESGASVEVLQRTLGHSHNSEATKIYDRSDRRDDVRAATSSAMRELIKLGKVSKQALLGPARA